MIWVCEENCSNVPHEDCSTDQMIMKEVQPAVNSKGSLTFPSSLFGELGKVRNENSLCVFSSRTLCLSVIVSYIRFTLYSF